MMYILQEWDEKVLWMFIFEIFIKETKFPVPTTKLEGL